MANLPLAGFIIHDYPIDKYTKEESCNIFNILFIKCKYNVKYNNSYAVLCKNRIEFML